MSLILVPSIFLYLLVCSILTLGRTRKFIPPPWYKGMGVEGTPHLSF